MMWSHDNHYFNNLNGLLNILEHHKIWYRIEKIREESIMVNVAIPGERWEIEFMEDTSIQIEIFSSDGNIFCDNEAYDMINNMLKKAME